VLEGLDAVEWDRLEHSRGIAGAEVPAYFRAILSADPSAGQTAVAALGDLLNHQLSVYEATVAAVPFLIELVASSLVQEREDILDLLSTIAHPHWWQRFEGESEQPLVGDAWERPISPTSGTALQRVTVAKKQVEHAYNAVAAGLPVYLRLLDEDPALRISALRVLSCFPRASDVVLPHIRSLLESAGDQSHINALVSSLARFPIDDPWYTAFCEQLIDYAPARETRLVAAIVQCRIAPNAPSPNAIALLAWAVATRYTGLNSSVFDILPVSAEPKALLAHLERGAVLQATPTLIEGLRACVDQRDFTFVLGAVVDMLFRNPRLPWAADEPLVAARRAALQAIVDNTYFPGDRSARACLRRLGRVLFADGLLGGGVTTRALLPEQRHILQILLEDPDWQGQSLDIALWVEQLLGSFFPNMQADHLMSLTAEQVTILHRIASTGFWDREPTALTPLLWVHGLPSTQKELTEYVATFHA